MRITIHRGTKQIGGCITEIESKGYRVFIDFGEQLPGSMQSDIANVPGLTSGDLSKSALFISHYHGDHIGRIGELQTELPIYVGTTALKVYKHVQTRLSLIPNEAIAQKYKDVLARLDAVRSFKALDKIEVGGMVVTPLFVDHSAFDAYMFIIEAEGKRILHTGDFRGHGMRSKGLIPTMENYAKNIDYIISEGSNIDSSTFAIKTEHELKRAFEQQFKENKYNFVYVSSTNLDRIFALYHAAKQAGRYFMCDGYQAGLMKIVTDNHKQHSPFYVVDYEQKSVQAGRFFELGHRDLLSVNSGLKKQMDSHGFCLLIRTNDKFKPLLNMYADSKDAKVYYSMWKGYLNSDHSAFNEAVYNFFKDYELEHIHTSGHADVSTLQSVFKTISAKEGIIPIHTENAAKFIQTFPEQNIILLDDGDSIQC